MGRESGAAVFERIESNLGGILDVQERTQQDVKALGGKVEGLEGRVQKGEVWGKAADKRMMEIEKRSNTIDLERGAVRLDHSALLTQEAWNEERWLRGYLLNSAPEQRYKDLGRGLMQETFPDRLEKYREHVRAFDLQSRAVLVSTTDLVPTPVFSDVIARLFEERSVRSRSKVVQLPSDQLRVPKVNAAFTAALVPENSAFPDGAGSYTSVLLNAIKFGALGTISLELVEDSPADVVTDFFARVIGAAAELENNQALEGDGTGNNFVGLFGAAGVAAVALTASPTTLDKFLEMLTSFPAPETIPGEMTWFMHPKAARKIGQIKATDNTSMVGEGILRSLLGVPVVLTDQIANNRGAGTNETTVYLGNFQRGMLLGDRGPEHLDTSISATDTVWNNGLLGVRYFRRTAISVALATVFAKGTGMTV